MNDFMMLCGTPLLAIAIIVIPMIILFNWDKIIKWSNE